MSGKKKLYSFVEVDDSVPIQKLKISDQLRVILKRLSYDPATELENEDFASVQLLTLRSDLSDFLYRATRNIRNGKNKSVVVSVASKFRPVLREVLNDPEISQFYTVQIAEPKIEYDIPYDVMVKLTVKDY